MRKNRSIIILITALAFLLAGGISLYSFTMEPDGKEYIFGYSSLLAGMICQQNRPVDKSENGYILEYSHLNYPEWRDGKFYAVDPLADWKTTTYPQAISMESVENLIETLDIKGENLLTRNANEFKELAEQPAFLLYEKDTGETALLLTNQGELYFQGDYYNGNKDAFIAAFPKFIEKSVNGDALDKEKFFRYWNEIQW